MAEQLSGSLQENLLTLLCFNDEAAPILANTLEPGLFENDVYKDVAIQAIDYFNTFKESPKDHISDLLETRLEDPKKEKIYAQVLLALYDNQENVNVKYVLDSLNKFISDQNLKTSIIEAANAIKTGDTSEARNILTKASKQEVIVFDPGTFFVDTKRSLRFLTDPAEPMPTGILPLDNMKIGPTPGELLIILAPPNRGKCIASSERIVLSDGRYLPIEQVVKNKINGCLSLNESLGTFEKSAISDHYVNGTKACVRLTTRMGRSCIVSKTHPFLSPTGWVNVLSFKPGDFIGTPRRLPVEGSVKVERELSSILAYLIAEGCVRSDSCTFTNNQKDLKDDFRHCVEHFGGSIRKCDDLTDACVGNPNIKGKYKNPIKNLVRGFELSGKLSKDKRVPEQIFTWTNECLKDFLNKLFTCDGSIYFEYDKYPVIEYGCASEGLIDDLNHLLLRFGIQGKISKNKEKGVFKWVTRNKKHVLKFINEIGFCSYKDEKCKKAKDLYEQYSRKTRNTYKDVVPYELVDKLLLEYPDYTFDPSDRVKFQQYKKNFRKGVSFDFLESLIAKYPEKDLAKYVLPDIYWDEVVAIEEAGDFETFDLTVPDTHNFVASDMLVHNTFGMVHLGKTAVRSGYKVLHVTLEMSEEKMSRRYVQGMFSFSTSKEEGRYAKFLKDEMGRFSSLDFKNITRPVIRSNEDSESRREIIEKIDRFKARWKLYIKRFPTNGLNIAGLEAYLDAMEFHLNFVPDLLILDYADLMEINANNLRIDTGIVYKNLRRIAVERNMAVVSASQTNKLAEDAKVITLKHLAEDYTKAATADTILAYCQTGAEQKLGLARLFLAKARDEERDQSILISQAYRFGQFCTDAIMMNDNKYWDELKIYDKESGGTTQRRQINFKKKGND